MPTSAPPGPGRVKLARGRARAAGDSLCDGSQAVAVDSVRRVSGIVAGPASSSSLDSEARQRTESELAN